MNDDKIRADVQYVRDLAAALKKHSRPTATLADRLILGASIAVIAYLFFLVCERLFA
jgi:hypothetical protein